MDASATIAIILSYIGSILKTAEIILVIVVCIMYISEHGKRKREADKAQEQKQQSEM